MREEFEAAFRRVLDSGMFASGPEVAKFEQEFGAFCNAEFCVGLGSGTEAVWLALLACGVGPGDEVITSPITFLATAEAISYSGATPAFVDVDERTYNISPENLAGALTSRTKAIIPVHVFGQMADMDPILKFAKEHRLVVIEDAAQAHGAEYKQHPAGSIGQIGCFSFYPGKNLGALGEAGAIVTNNSQLCEAVRKLRDHGQAKKYYHDVIGWNCRMDAIQAACLEIKLRHLAKWNELRRAHAHRYALGFADVEEVITPVEADYGRHVYHVYAIRVKERQHVIQRLEEKGIGYGVHYPLPLHRQKAYAHLGYGQGDFPIAEQLTDEFLSLPMYPELRPEQIDYVIEVVTEAVGAGVTA
jgi:dTDP-4-amino-4,6-dideoxygalactose transaminase